MKTHKGIKRRLKITKKGKIMHRRAGARHLMSSKTGKRKRQLRNWQELSKAERKKLKAQYNYE